MHHVTSIGMPPKIGTRLSLSIRCHGWLTYHAPDFSGIFAAWEMRQRSECLIDRDAMALRRQQQTRRSAPDLGYSYRAAL